MLVLGICDTLKLKWSQITTDGRGYTCPTKEINGELFFHFKKVWHPIAQYASDCAEILVDEGGKVFSRPSGNKLGQP